VSADFGWAGSGLERAAEEAGSENEPKIAKLYSLRNVSVDLPRQLAAVRTVECDGVITHTGVTEASSPILLVLMVAIVIF
jgi:hypothetical protein